jgi:hypothetical protein
MRAFHGHIVAKGDIIDQFAGGAFERRVFGGCVLLPTAQALVRIKVAQPVVIYDFALGRRSGDEQKVAGKIVRVRQLILLQTMLKVTRIARRPRLIVHVGLLLDKDAERLKERAQG